MAKKPEAPKEEPVPVFEPCAQCIHPGSCTSANWCQRGFK